AVRPWRGSALAIHRTRRLHREHLTARKSRRCVFPFASRKGPRALPQEFSFACSRHCGLPCSWRQSGPGIPECLPAPAGAGQFRKLRALQRTSPQGDTALPVVLHESFDAGALPLRACCAVGVRMMERLEGRRPAILEAKILPEEKNTVRCRRHHAPGREERWSLHGFAAPRGKNFLPVFWTGNPRAT